MAGKKGFLGGLVDAVKAEVMDSGDAPKAKVAPAPSPAAEAPPPVQSGTVPYSFGTSPAGATSAASFAVSTTAPEPLDPKVVEMVSSGVFTNIHDDGKSRPSRYMQFSKMWEALGRPADANVPLRAMIVNDDKMTAGAVLQDIDAHLEMLDGVETSATAEFDQAAAQKLGGADSQLNSIQQANEAALREIERHQNEIAARNAEAAAIQTQRATDEASINRARGRTAAAVASIRTQLTGARTLFASLS